MKTIFNLNINKWRLAVIIPCCIVSLASCKKYLDAKPDKSLVVPTTLNDLQAILDYSSRMNVGTSYGEASADDYYLTDNDYNSLSDDVKKAYIWENFSYFNYPNDWARVYDVIYPSNLVLEGIAKIAPDEENKAQRNNIEGSALVFRALSLLQGAFIFCKAYDENTADKDLGMVLRLHSDFAAASKRSTLRETYDQIIKDLKDAAPLLPETPIHPVRPSRAAAYGLLARTYLSMRKYDSCQKYASLCLNIKHNLFDFNSMADINSTFAFPQFNDEVIMATLINNVVYYSILQPFALVDSTLYNSYSENDLRKKAFFTPLGAGYNFKGSYSGTPWELFMGIATDEVYLMRAECYAREGHKEAALSDLNTLLESKWKAGTFIPLEAASAVDALGLILAERRKQLLFRNLRWMDIKRLNKEGYDITITRKVNGKVYTLTPNDNRYALPLPIDIIERTGMEQNPK